MINEEQLLRKKIRDIINETLDTMDLQQYYNPSEERKDNDSETHTIQNSGVKMKRKRVIERLKNPSTDCAPFAYKLWPDKDPDNARSQFYKCRDGELNDNGDAYSFTDQEITRLYSMLNDMNI